MQMKHSSKSVLRVLADYANDYGKCFPSNETIATEACVTPRTVVAAIDDLEQLKVIEVDRKQGRHNIYKIIPENFTGEIAPIKERATNYTRDDAQGSSLNFTFEPIDIDLTSEILAETSENPAKTHEIVSPYPYNHYRTTGGDMRAREDFHNDENLGSDQNQNSHDDFQPVNRKFQVLYQSHDYNPCNFIELENQYSVEKHFKLQAQAAFPDLNTTSVDLIYSEFKRYWLDNFGKKTIPHKWMSQWITRLEYKQQEYVQRQQRESKHQQRVQQPAQEMGYFEQMLSGQQEHQDHEIRDVYPVKKLLIIEEYGHA